MEEKKRASKNFAVIAVEPYLAEYAKKKFVLNRNNGGLVIPPTSDLYHCVWHHMSRPPREFDCSKSGNLKISLPCRRSSTDEGPWKDPAYYNYLSSTAAHNIETCLRRMFNYEFHAVMIENDEQGRPMRQIEVVEDFINRYQLQSISSDALLKNYQRYRRRIHPKRPRRYVRRHPSLAHNYPTILA